MTGKLKWLNLVMICLLLLATQSQGQVVTADTLINTKPGEIVIDSTVLADSIRHKRIKRTIIHSAIIPGWGQINNKQAWKLPFVYAAVGIPVYAFFYNLNTYKDLRQAYIYRTDTFPGNDVLVPPEYGPGALSLNSLKRYRDEFRKNVDYSALIFIVAWGLNVADAAVFAHLKDFDVSDKLSMRVKPGMNLNGQTNISLLFSFKKPTVKYNPYISP